MRRLILGGALVLGVGLVIGLASLGSGQGTQLARSGTQDSGARTATSAYANQTEVQEGVVPEDKPLIGGVRMTLDEAAELMPFPLYRPNDDVASDELISGVWALRALGDGAPMTAIQYSTGLTVYLQPEWIGAVHAVKSPEGGEFGEEFGEESDDTPADFDALALRLAAQQAEEFGGSPDDYLAELDGAPAYLAANGLGSYPSTILFSYKGVRIDIRGEVSAEVLIRVAGSIS